MTLQEFRQIAANGIWKQNTSLVQILGLCPLLAVTTNLVNGAMLSLATILVMAMSGFAIASLRNLIPGELAKGFGFFQSKAPTAFSPVAVTPDELGEAWDGGTLNLPLLSYLNGKLFGKPNARTDMTFDFGKLISHAARTRPLSAGMIIGSGTVSNKDADGGPGRTVEEGGVGYSCIAEIRAVETIRSGKPSTPFLSFGDSVKIEMLDAAGKSIFGAIDHKVEKA